MQSAKNSPKYGVVYFFALFFLFVRFIVNKNLTQNMKEKNKINKGSSKIVMLLVSLWVSIQIFWPLQIVNVCIAVVAEEKPRMLGRICLYLINSA